MVYLMVNWMVAPKGFPFELETVDLTDSDSSTVTKRVLETVEEMVSRTDPETAGRMV
jgi:hypothetical protein